LSGFQDKGIPPEIRLSLEGGFLLGLTEAARQRGVPGVVIYPTDPSQSLDTTRFLDRLTDGLIVQSDPWGENLLRDLDPARVSVVGIWTQEVKDGMGFADVDHSGGAIQATTHLLELGHRRIAVFGPAQAKMKKNENFRYRHQGYQDALMQVGIALNSRWYAENHHDVLRLMKEEQITAVFAMNDRRAIEMITALQGFGVRVPKDLSVVGFDNALGTDLVAGGLTTVSYSVLELGQVALENLLRLIQGKPALQCRTVISTNLIVRRSTAVVQVSKTKKGQ
jgi:LacI family transcriptional regulator